MAWQELERPRTRLDAFAERIKQCTREDTWFTYDMLKEFYKDAGFYNKRILQRRWFL